MSAAGCGSPRACPAPACSGWAASSPTASSPTTSSPPRIDTNDEWIRSRVGIESRRIADKDTHLVDMAADAGARAVKDAGLEPTDIDTVIVATCTMPDHIPNAAAQTAHRIGIVGARPPSTSTPRARASATGSASAADLVRAGTVRHVLVIGAEKLSDWMDWDDRSTASSSPTARAPRSSAPRRTRSRWASGRWPGAARATMAQTIRINPDTRALHQEGQAVFRWATTQVAPVALRAIELAGLTPADIDVLVPHQANLRIVEAVAKRLRSKGARDDMRVADDIVHSGNTSSASIPLALDHMRAQGRLRSGDDGAARRLRRGPVLRGAGRRLPLSDSVRPTPSPT